MAQPYDLVQAASNLIGTPYTYGGKTAKTGLDCSGLVALAMREVGLAYPQGSLNQLNAVTKQISVEEAWDTPGAFLYRPGHCAISTGTREAIEAITPKVTKTGYSATINGQPRWTHAGLLPGIDYNSPQKGSGNMYNPAVGRVSSEFSAARKHPITGIVQAHAGIDIANSTGTNIHAAFAGKVIRAGWDIVSQRTGQGILIENPDKERQYYGHLSYIAVKVGDKVSKGQIIGRMGATGRVTGPHLHFETWNSSGRAVNPRIYFNFHKLTPGVAMATAPAPKPPAPTKSDPKVLAYQKRQNKYGKAGLVEDGVEGPVTRKWRDWVKTLQQALNRWRAVAPKLLIDGDYGAATDHAVYQAQKANPAQFGSKPDRVVGKLTTAALGIKPKP